MIVFAPTVVAEVPLEAEILCEEAWSPVCTRATSSAPSESVIDWRPGMLANEPWARVGPGGAVRRGEA